MNFGFVEVLDVVISIQARSADRGKAGSILMVWNFLSTDLWSPIFQSYASVLIVTGGFKSRQAYQTKI